MSNLPLPENVTAIFDLALARLTLTGHWQDESAGIEQPQRIAPFSSPAAEALKLLIP